MMLSVAIRDFQILVLFWSQVRMCLFMCTFVCVAERQGGWRDNRDGGYRDRRDGGGYNNRGGMFTLICFAV